MHHDQVGIELGVDDDPAQYGLRQHPHDQATAQVDQVTPTGSTEDGGQERRGHRQREDDGDQAVAELDQPVELKGRGEVPTVEHSGQSLQPSPEPVRRTAPPVTTMRADQRPGPAR